MRRRISEALQLPTLPKILAIFILMVFIAGSSLIRCDMAIAGDYDRDDAWNPLRVGATIVYPAGYLLEQVVIRPIHHLGEESPFYEIFGQDTFDEAYE